ncbi:hypothetical protein [Mucisphaera calidilacus]|uniref:Dockerin domain-containing protein n=1 Tax=Mucisphaera calidilacus TaxID=2527982 RepID=A0A518BTT4_9BACT|nr:hypothetical protein [Mucisphaera calidilacus]QDU70383.1 hypothetical protein Pan265_02090 [Mucisphaera calidilacus]
MFEHLGCSREVVAAAVGLGLISATALAGPYSANSNDPGNAFDPPVAKSDPGITAWNGVLIDYSPAPGVGVSYRDPVTGYGSLGELYDPANPPATGQIPPFSGATQPFSGDVTDTDDEYGFTGYDDPGSAVIELAHPLVDGPGFDFAVFENGFSGFAGGFFAELAFVEVSSDGEHFVRFDAVSTNTPGDLQGISQYAGLDETNVYNLAGKHATNWGTPFDLAQLAGSPGLDLAGVRFVRLVDIPGNGHFIDSLGNPILDAHPTVGSGGFDLSYSVGGIALLTAADAVAGDVDGDGVVTAADIDTLVAGFGGVAFDVTGDRQTDASDLERLVTDLIGTSFGDANLDHHVDLLDLSSLASSFGDSAGWADGDFNADGTVDLLDLSLLASGFGASSVPEPAVALLLSLGLVVDASRR